MKKLLFVVILGLIGYGLYTHWEETQKVVQVVNDRPFRSWSDQEILEKESEDQKLILLLYRKKDASYQGGIHKVDDYNQVRDYESTILEKMKEAEDLRNERTIRRVTRWTGQSLWIIIPAAVFFVLASRILRRRPRRPTRYPDGSLVLKPSRPSGLRFWKKPPQPQPSPIRVGATQAEILARLGPPLSRTNFTSTEAWNYRLPIHPENQGPNPEWTEYQSLVVLFKDKKVFDISWDNSDSDLDPLRLT